MTTLVVRAFLLAMCPTVLVGYAVLTLAPGGHLSAVSMYQLQLMSVMSGGSGCKAYLVAPLAEIQLS
jgi:hypothetical protein